MISASPLVSLSAAAIDTETTSLDARKARIVQLGAIRIVGGRIAHDQRLEQLVAPGEPIPAASTAVHGISDAMVGGQPDFQTAIGGFNRFIGKLPVLGFALSFDLGVLKHEHERCGLPWMPPRCLDLSELVRIVAPPLPSHSLESVAAWLDVEIEPGKRHTALGDALVAARIFLKLVPHLRARGIRTFAEAEQACRRLPASTAPFDQRGQPVSAHASAESDAVLARIDSYPFRHRAADVMSSPAITVAPNATLQEALGLMLERRISSVFVDWPGSPAQWGIVTERDLLRALAEDPSAALQREVASAASRPLVAVRTDDFLFKAYARMQRGGFRHLGVVDEDSRLVGALSQRDLLRQRVRDAAALSDAVDGAAGIAELPAYGASLRRWRAPCWRRRSIRAISRRSSRGRSAA